MRKRDKPEKIKFEILQDTIDMVVAGEVIRSDIKTELTIGTNLSEEMDRISARINYWNGVHEASNAEAIQLDAMYRRFRGLKVEQILGAKGCSGLAEWKVKAKIDASDGYMNHMNAKAICQRNTGQLSTIVKALFLKGELLRSRGANERREKGAQDMNTKDAPSEGRRGSMTDAEREARVERVRKKMKKKRKKI